jgi:hypothetical protein
VCTYEMRMIVVCIYPTAGGEARDLFVLLLILMLASHCIALHVLVLVVEEQEQPQHREGPVEWEDKRNKLTNTFFSHRATTPSTPTSTS